MKDTYGSANSNSRSIISNFNSNKTGMIATASSSSSSVMFNNHNANSNNNNHTNNITSTAIIHQQLNLITTGNNSLTLTGSNHNDDTDIIGCSSEFIKGTI